MARTNKFITTTPSLLPPCFLPSQSPHYQGYYCASSKVIHNENTTECGKLCCYDDPPLVNRRWNIHRAETERDCLHYWDSWFPGGQRRYPWNETADALKNSGFTWRSRLPSPLRGRRALKAVSHLCFEVRRSISSLCISLIRALVLSGNLMWQQLYRSTDSLRWYVDWMRNMMQNAKPHCYAIMISIM